MSSYSENFCNVDSESDPYYGKPVLVEKKIYNKNGLKNDLTNSV